MKFDHVEAKQKLGELTELLKERKGKTVTGKLSDECYSKIRWLEMFLLRAREDELTEIMERIHKVTDGQWEFELPEGEKVTVRGAVTLASYPEAANVLSVRALTREEEQKIWEAKS